MLLLLSLLGCAPDGDGGPVDRCEPARLADAEPRTTLATRRVPDPGIDPPLELSPSFPEGLAAAFEAGLGGWSDEPGDPHRLREDLGARTPAADPHSLAVIVHHSDAQLADAESPVRFAGGDMVGATQSAARPQELYAIHALDGLIRAANALGRVVPIDFAIATGDNADNAQGNETAWFRDVWDGAPVHPDSGADDAQPDADCNDPIAPFQPAGAEFPWYAVAGNHDVLVQGNFGLTGFLDLAVGTDAPFGTRDLSLPGGPLTEQAAVADPARALLDRAAIAATYLDSPANPGPVGHGFTADNTADGTAHWEARPVPGLPLVLLGLDCNPPDPSNGSLTAFERDTFLLPALARAEAAGDLVIVTSHYALGGLSVEGGGTVGELLLDHPLVILSLVGHSHVNRVTPYARDGHGFYEIETASTADWPLQGRLVELVDNRDGTLSVFGTLFEPHAPEGSMARRAVTLAALDLQSGWRLWDGSGEEPDRNVELVIPTPAGWVGAEGTPGAHSPGL